MLGVALIAVVLAGAACVLWREVRLTMESHSLAGRLGALPQERAISKRTAALLAAAESCARLGAFLDAVRTHAWHGTPLRMRRRSAVWSEWTFANGDVWEVRTRTPRHAPKMVVQAAALTTDGLAVTAYGPCGALSTIELAVRDVHVGSHP